MNSFFFFFSSPDWPLFTRLLLPVLCIKSLFVHAHGSLSAGEGEVGNQRGETSCSASRAVLVTLWWAGVCVK